MDRITVDELHELMGEGRVGKVIDVRSPMSQAMTGRIPGAMTVDPQNMKCRPARASSRTAKSSSIARARTKHTAAKVAKALMQHGFKRVRPLHGGIDAWIEAGHDVQR